MFINSVLDGDQKVLALEDCVVKELITPPEEGMLSDRLEKNFLEHGKAESAVLRQRKENRE